MSMPQRFDADKWFVDSGASSHMTPMKEMMTDYKKFSTPEKVTVRDGRTVNAIGKGNIRVDMLMGKEEKRSILYYMFRIWHAVYSQSEQQYRRAKLCHSQILLVP